MRTVTEPTSNYYLFFVLWECNRAWAYWYWWAYSLSDCCVSEMSQTTVRIALGHKKSCTILRNYVFKLREKWLPTTTTTTKIFLVSECQDHNGRVLRFQPQPTWILCKMEKKAANATKLKWALAKQILCFYYNIEILFGKIRGKKHINSMNCLVSPLNIFFLFFHCRDFFFHSKLRILLLIIIICLLLFGYFLLNWWLFFSPGSCLYFVVISLFTGIRDHFYLGGLQW